MHDDGLHPMIRAKRERQLQLRERRTEKRQRNQKIVDMYRQEGRTAQEIQDILGLSRSVVYKALKEQNVIPPKIGKKIPEPPRFRRREPTEVVEHLLRLSRGAGRFA